MVFKSACRERHATEWNDGNHQTCEHNPLKSCNDHGDHLNPWAVYDDDLDNSSMDHSTGNFELEEGGGGYLTEDDLELYKDEDDDQLDNYGAEDTNGQCSTAVSKLQIRLNDLINRRKAPLVLYDEIIHLLNGYISSNNFSKHAKLMTRQSFIKHMEISHPGITTLCPVNKQITLHNNTLVTVPVFDAHAMIMDILTNTELMNQENIADGYDIFTGDVDENHESNRNYGEIHTGDEWIPARDRYCRPQDNFTNDMPVGIVIFGDKSHTDLHGALALTPIIFTLPFFNEKCRNNPKFWRVLGYVPNLGYGKNKSNKTPTVNKIQDEHDCLSCVFESIRQIHRNGGFRATVLGKEVNIRIWIHYFIGDTEGNNKWLGHYQGNKSQVHRPYRDCTCSFHELSNPNPSCVYTTMNEGKTLS